MIINELFYSLQGEGRLAGVPSIFIRLAGCPLRCRWCDTTYAQKASAGNKFSPDWLLEQVHSYSARHIVITGGEPMTQANLSNFIRIIAKPGIHMTIETAGLMFIPDLPCDLMSISPKLSNSIPQDVNLAGTHDKIRLNIPAIKQLTEAYPYQLKFVVDTRSDLDEIIDVINLLGDIRPRDIFLMPQATNRPEYIDKSIWLSEYCLRTGFSFGPRLQVMLWPGQRAK